jgi:Arc/MetJ-type ribon-helix-helix transcriptional regulator
MAERMHRTQILLEPAQHQALGRIAHAERRSVSEVVREILQQALQQREEERSATIARRLAALDRIREHREAIQAENGGKPLDFDVVEAINQAREEQDARNFEVLFGHLEPRD